MAGGFDGMGVSLTAHRTVPHTALGVVWWELG